MKRHRFANSLAGSHKRAREAWWEGIYKNHFGAQFLSMHYIEGDGYAQRSGIDRVIILKSARRVTVDEKVREPREDGREFTDVALERWSDAARRLPGWIQKPLECDYIAYANFTLKRPTCELFPTLDLQRAWFRCGRMWVATYPIIRAENNGYTTESVGVPPKVIWDAIRDTSSSAIQEPPKPDLSELRPDGSLDPDYYRPDTWR